MAEQSGVNRAGYLRERYQAYHPRGQAGEEQG